MRPAQGIGLRPVVEQLQEGATDDRARLKAGLRRVVRPVPVAHRHAMRRGVQEVPDGRDERLEVIARARQCRGPPDPIELRVEAPIVQCEAIAVLRAAVECHFLPGDGGRKEVETQDAIPDEVVLLAPRARLIESTSTRVSPFESETNPSARRSSRHHAESRRMSPRVAVASARRRSPHPPNPRSSPLRRLHPA